MKSGVSLREYTASDLTMWPRGSCREGFALSLAEGYDHVVIRRSEQSTRGNVVVVVVVVAVVLT